MVLIVGGCAWDVTLKVPSLPVLGQDGLKGKMTRMAPGGKATNSAAWASLAGASVRLLTRAGVDEHGRRIRLALGEMRDVDARVCDGEATRVCMVLITPDGQRTIFKYAEGRIDEPDPDMYTPADFAGAKVTWIDVPEHQARFAELAAGPVGLPLQRMTDQTADGRWAFAVGSADDVTGEHLAAAQSPGGVDWYILTRGAAPIKVWTRGQGSVEIDVAPVGPAYLVDTCGAGDAFLGGVLAALCRGESPARAAESGAQVGRMSVMQPGSWPVG